jgi:hypothetical protein
MKLAALAMGILATTSLFAGTRRGPFAFHYEPVLTEAQLAWYSRFELLVTHDPLPRAQVERLHAAGTKLLLYEWSVAFYDARATRWQRSLIGSRQVLNETPLSGGTGSATAGAWYFDPAANGSASHRAADLVRRLRAAHYDGVFFDTTTVESVHPSARNEYERRHAGLSYDEAFARFLRELRRQWPAIAIFTNQGFRSAEHYLPYADWDLTESLITHPGGDGFVLRPWNDEARPWQSIRFLMRALIEPAAQRYPRVRFGHLNYVSAPDPETILLAFSIARVFGGEAFVATPSIEGEESDVYFLDLGAPVSPAIDLESGAATMRAFEKGTIVITDGMKDVALLGARGLRNWLTSQIVCDDTIILPANDGVPRAYVFELTSGCTP